MQHLIFSFNKYTQLKALQYFLSVFYTHLFIKYVINGLLNLTSNFTNLLNENENGESQMQSQQIKRWQLTQKQNNTIKMQYDKTIYE